MSELTKGFEKYFPLPWEVKIIDTATFIQSGFERESIPLNLTLTTLRTLTRLNTWFSARTSCLRRWSY